MYMDILTQITQEQYDGFFNECSMLSMYYNLENEFDYNPETKQYEAESIQENLLNYIQFFFPPRNMRMPSELSHHCKRITKTQIYVLVPYYCRTVSLYT